jgi:hypothetical protein
MRCRMAVDAVRERKRPPCERVTSPLIFALFPETGREGLAERAAEFARETGQESWNRPLTSADCGGILEGWRGNAAEQTNAD